MLGQFPLHHWRVHLPYKALSHCSYVKEMKRLELEKASMCVLAFLAVFEQVQKQMEHVNAITFHPLPPRWQAEGHQVQHTTALVQGSIAQDHFSMHYTAQNLRYANKRFLLFFLQAPARF